ncbi:hypothetical protein MJ923_18560 [Shewanella sp. 3B26]|uniref:Uncharacterized protein n=1 Tax=Shewanella zhuhaiensis TaxID=2919576 RepID=A0AAJ1BK73_9GAMM|nr:hypothetical protein [Shewanella zhuhaiensis]MCH4296318.1 hypothetical protein [Shewanella zhuhaiensis]
MFIIGLSRLKLCLSVLRPGQRSSASQPPSTSHQPSAISHQPSAISHQHANCGAIQGHNHDQRADFRDQSPARRLISIFTTLSLNSAAQHDFHPRQITAGKL